MVLNESAGNTNVINDLTNKKVIFDYPCTNNHVCTDYEIQIYPGRYKFELYGASGGHYSDLISSYIYPNGDCISSSIVSSVGGNAVCNKVGSRGGSGGYVSGKIRIKNLTKIFATIGGQGIYGFKNLSSGSINYLPENMIAGGYGGGGSASNFIELKGIIYSGSGSGGGQTSVKFLVNDLWHRVIVSGGGGGSDNGPEYSDDGSSGAGGNLVAQGYWIAGTYTDQKVANSLSGFTFGSGEAAQQYGSKNPNGITTPLGESDRSGSGGGWFGGFAGHQGNGGSGGGSSWVLTKDADIPSVPIEARDEFYEYIDSQYYAFNETSDYYFYQAVHVPGVWVGNGRLIITQLDENPYSCNNISPIAFLSLFNIPIMVFISI